MVPSTLHSARKAVRLAFLAMAWAHVPSICVGQVHAHLRLDAVSGGCAVDDEDPWPLGDPERYYRMAVFDSLSAASACPNTCTGDSNPATLDGTTRDNCPLQEGCGVMIVPGGFEIDKVTPNLSGAYFYFGLWDEDSVDPADSLGDNWFFASASRTATDSNGNNSPYRADNPIATVCGNDVEGAGSAGNFQVTTSVWFTDASGPTAPSSLRHMDDGVSTFWDNDNVIDFTWTNGTDPNSGIKGHRSSLWRDLTGSSVWNDVPTGSGGANICPSGCTHGYTVQHGETYWFLTGAENGSYPVTTNPSLAYTSWLQFGVDLVSPTTSFVSPPASTWERANFTIDLADSDSGSGLLLCEWQVISSGVTTLAYTARTCDGTTSATVGATGHCRHQGANTCQVSARSTDNARRVTTVTRTFGIDWTADTVSSFTARTSATGTPIADGAWTNDNDPWISTTFGTPISPIVGGSWLMDGTPDCTVDTSGSPISVQLPTLTDGTHLYEVRPIDAPGNCGTVGIFTFRIDTTPDVVPTLTATGAGGSPPIGNGVWQNLNDVDMSWGSATSTAPISGYSYAVNTAADCSSETAGLVASLVNLPEGSSVFAVRAIDAAGNCGASSTFTIAVDTQGDAVTGLAAYAASGGSPILPRVWQGDNDPFLDWPDVVSTSPIAGYNVAVDMAPACAVAITASEYQFPADAIPDGKHVIQVRARDEAGNCGPVATFEIWVNSVQGQSPGRILNGLRLAKSGADVDMTWTAACQPAGTDYSIHEGALGTWYSHQAIECTTFGSTAATITPGAGVRYYLVVPVSFGEEGSYGSDSAGAERPPSSAPCLPQAPPAACP